MVSHPQLHHIATLNDSDDTARNVDANGEGSTLYLEATVVRSVAIGEAEIVDSRHELFHQLKFWLTVMNLAMILVDLVTWISVYCGTGNGGGPTHLAEVLQYVDWYNPFNIGKSNAVPSTLGI
jgi:hypothetical protein